MCDGVSHTEALAPHQIFPVYQVGSVSQTFASHQIFPVCQVGQVSQTSICLSPNISYVSGGAGQPGISTRSSPNISCVSGGAGQPDVSTCSSPNISYASAPGAGILLNRALSSVLSNVRYVIHNNLSKVFWKVMSRVFTKQNKNFVRLGEPKQTETRSVWVDFRFFRKTKKICFGYFAFLTRFETTQTNRSVSKQTVPVSKQPKQTNQFRNI
jgi:hypothetical protein